LKKYNNDTVPDSHKTSEDLRINNFERISFPLIYDELGALVPHTLDQLLLDVKFAEYRDTIKSDDTLMVNLDVNGKRSFLFYE